MITGTFPRFQGRFLLLILFLAAVISLLGQADIAWCRSAPPERVVLVCDSDYKPFEFLDADNQPKGLFIDHWRAWSRSTGIEVEFRCMEWSRALETVLQGQADMVTALFRIPERQERFDFTRDYFQLTTHIFYHEQIYGLRGLKDLEGFTVGVHRGDAAEDFLRRAMPELELRLYESYDAMVTAALAGVVRVFVADTPVAAFHLAKHDDGGTFKKTTEPLYVENIHAAVRKGDTVLLELVNQGMDSMPPDTMERIVHDWVGPREERVLPWRVLGLAAVAVLLPLGLVALWNRQLRRRVARGVAELRESEDRFRAIFDNTFQFTGLLSIEGRVVEVNRTALASIGAQAEDLRGRYFWETPWWGGSSSGRKRLQEAVRRAAAGEFVRYEAENETTQGDSFVMDFSLKPLRNQAGEVTMLIAEARDITERKIAERNLQAYHDNLEQLVQERTKELSLANEALLAENAERRKVEEALRASEEKHRMLVENAAEGIVVIQGSTLRFVNPVVEAISGFKAKDLVGHSFIELVHPEDRALVAEYYHKRMSGEKSPSRYSFRVIDRSGEVRWLDNSVGRISWDGEPASLAMLNDITERKQVEQALLRAKRLAEDASRIMNDFVAVVSHELRTPMTSVLGFTKLIEKDFARWFLPSAKGDAEQHKRALRIKDNLEIVIVECERLAALISDVLDLAKLEARKYDFHMERSNLEPLLLQAANSTSTFFQGRDVEFVMDIPEGLSEVFCDRKSVVQVLVNLIVNAAKFTKQGEVRVSVGQPDEQPDMLAVSVSDTGAGIAPEDLVAIFEKYHQTRETLTDKPKGTGLGLAICREMVQQHGGVIDVQSVLGQGSTVTFTLPVYGREALDPAQDRKAAGND
jgi:PAS domain S-box-containing protein